MDEDRPGEVPAGGGTGRRSGTLLSGISFPAGVAGLWRRLDCLDEITEWRIVIVVAGMEGALFSVIAGQVPGLVAGQRSTARSPPVRPAWSR